MGLTGFNLARARVAAIEAAAAPQVPTDTAAPARVAEAEAASAALVSRRAELAAYAAKQARNKPGPKPKGKVA